MSNVSPVLRLQHSLLFFSGTAAVVSRKRPLFLGALLKWGRGGADGSGMPGSQNEKSANCQGSGRKVPTRKKSKLQKVANDTKPWHYLTFFLNFC